MSSISNEWLSVSESYRVLAADLPDFFPSIGAWRHHLKNRDRNGLAARDAVRMSPIGGQLLVNVTRVKAWVVADPAPKRQRASAAA